MKVKVVWLGGAVCAGIAILSLLPAPYETAAVETGAGFLDSPHADEWVLSKLRGSCGDCHSNETKWPWYSRVFPASWLVRRDVSEGRRFLNFNMWREYGTEGQVQLLKFAAARVKAGSMPPERYLALHAEARLNSSESARLAAALERESAQLAVDSK